MKIPKSWDDITMGNFTTYLQVCKDKTNPSEDKVQLLTRKVSAILGVSIEEAKRISIEDLNKVTKIMGSKLPSRLMLSFKLNGKRYRPIIDARKLNGEKYAAVKLAQSRDSLDTLPQILFIISERRKFGIWKSFPFIGYKTIEPKPEDIEQSVNDFKQLSVGIGYPMTSFFLNVCKELKRHLKDFSLKEVEKMMKEMHNLQMDLEKDMDL
jgi:hypothetical protein